MAYQQHKSVANLPEELRRIYEADPAIAESNIENHLRALWKGIPENDRLELLHELQQEFARSESGQQACASFDPDVLSKLVALLLGERWLKADLDHDELMDRLTRSLNTIFNVLNQMIIAIHTMLLGAGTEPETIRQVIGSDLQSTGSSNSLENYLDQIRMAFLISHRAFQEAARNKIGDILKELHPLTLADSLPSGLNLGPWKKARLFDEFTERFEKIEAWFDSERFWQDLLREFEKHCRLQYSKGRMEKCEN